MSSVLRSALPKTVKEFRLLCCQRADQSKGAREFVVSVYPEIKKANPELPFLIREAEGVPARAFARFEKGFEKEAMLDGLTATEVEKKIGDLVRQGGAL